MSFGKAFSPGKATVLLTGCLADLHYVITYLARNMWLQVGRVCWYGTLVCVVIPILTLLGGSLGFLLAHIAWAVVSGSGGSATTVPNPLEISGAISGGGLGLVVAFAALPWLTYAEMRRVISSTDFTWDQLMEGRVLGGFFGLIAAAGLLVNGQSWLALTEKTVEALSFATVPVFAVGGGMWMAYLLCLSANKRKP